MNPQDIFDLILPIGFGLILLVLVWFIFELILTVRHARATVDDIHTKITPTLEHVEEITASIKPAISKVDPLVERVSLTVDAANLEIMRLDQILEDVNDITDTVSSAVNAVDTAANAPIELVSNVTSRVRKAFRSKKASSESVALGDKRLAESGREDLGETKQTDSDYENLRRERKAEKTQISQAKHAAAEVTRESAAAVNEAVKAAIDQDSETIQNRYFTYGTTPRSNDESSTPSPFEAAHNEADLHTQGANPQEIYASQPVSAQEAVDIDQPVDQYQGYVPATNTQEAYGYQHLDQQAAAEQAFFDPDAMQVPQEYYPQEASDMSYYAQQGDNHQPIAEHSAPAEQYNNLQSVPEIQLPNAEALPDIQHFNQQLVNPQSVPAHQANETFNPNN